MSTSDPLADLERLGDDALGPCVNCGKPMLQAPVAVFYRVQVQFVGLDLNAIRERAGLAAMVGGSLAIADAMGSHKKPGVVMDSGTVNLCLPCSQHRPDLMELMTRALEDEPGSEPRA